jgi:hypothetical protein
MRCEIVIGQEITGMCGFLFLLLFLLLSLFSFLSFISSSNHFIISIFLL